jgi:cation diffusion facilitator CzcD-associated flavoprotein CzcO
VLLLRCCKHFTQLIYHSAACDCQAVIGAGPCGLAVARELVKAGHSITIFEAGDGVGGAWRFDEAATDSDLLGLESNRVRVHSSM